MGLFDWIGPTSLTKRRGWGQLPSPAAEQKASPFGPPAMAQTAAFTVRTLIHGPGATEALYGAYGSAANSAVYACLQTIARGVAEPDLRVYRILDGERIEQTDTELGALLALPNPHFSIDTLLAYVATCLDTDGNAYWRKLRAGSALTGNVVELWPISPSRITPVTENGSSQFIDFYRYSYSGSGSMSLAPSDVVHFRNGLDDRDHRLGCSPLKRLVREIAADDQATRYAERLLANLAINGLTLSFDKEAPPIDQATADELKTRIIAAYGGDNVGATAVLSPGAQLTALGFSPEQMDMKTLHRVPEERISAVLGVPAIVAGLGAGLDRSTYSNVREAREQFTEQKLIPLWRSLAADVTRQLVPDFSSDPQILVEFDIEQIRALAEDANKDAERLKILTEAGILTADEARAELGYEPRPVRSAAGSGSAAASARSPVERRSRPRVIALPPPETKAAEDLPRRYGEQRADELPTWESELITFLEAQLRRVTRRLRAGADTALDLVPEGEAVLLGETLTPLQLRLLGEVERMVAAELGISFQLDDAATRQYLRTAGANIVGITETTRAAVQEALLEGQMEGEGIEPLARRLRDLPAFGQARARVVARTELGTSQNTAALSSYVASGVVVGIRVLDGDYDAACQAMNGRTFTLDQAPPALQHPNCVRAFAPLTDAADLTRSA